ncbi:chemotaxis protein CheW [Allohahella marinimesophila]|uniref:Chemotaxis protein CheW n=2 Tax=Allohahella marinimesophila TaxID=1054972 RepID=A0ABP7NKJ0_9GAMM
MLNADIPGFSAGCARHEQLPDKEDYTMASSSGQAKASDDPVLQYVTFRLDHETYGINVMQIQEVLRYTEIAPVPGSPSYVMGIINLRGNVVTVIDTRQRFGLSQSEVSDSSRIVVIEVDSQVMGILVDSVAEVVYLRQSEIESAPNVGNEESAKFIHGVCNKNGELIILVEFEKLMLDEEWGG